MTIADTITQRLQAREKLFLPRAGFLDMLGAKLRQQLEVTSQTTADALGEALRRHCGNRLRLARGGRTIYVALDLPDEAFLLDKAKRLTGFTAKQFSQHLPLTQERFFPAFTRLLEQGQLVCIALKPGFLPYFQIASSPVPGALSAPIPSINEDRGRFHQVFLEIGQGRNFVFIHRLRAALGWERKRFDHLIRQLQAEGRLLLNMGDPTQLTADEVRNSFQDDNGMLYLTLNWLERRP